MEAANVWLQAIQDVQLLYSRGRRNSMPSGLPPNEADGLSQAGLAGMNVKLFLGFRVYLKGSSPHHMIEPSVLKMYIFLKRCIIS